MAMRCPHCNSETPDGSSTCLACHAPLVDPLLSTQASGASELTASATRMQVSTPVPVAPFFGIGGMPAGFLFASRYRVERLLGAGGMGAVYQAWDHELDVRVALKVIRPDVLGTSGSAQDFEQRFKQELLMARQVTHRNVTRIHDLGDSGGVKYITMQYVEGISLAGMIEQGALPFERVLAIAKQLASGISAAHDAGVIHRDLKPQNILIDAGVNVYISDFGLAKSLEATTMAALTRPGELLGTPQYISPEQIQGKAADHRSDLYALGLMFFEMATGELPFAANSAAELMYQRVQQPAKDTALLKRSDLPEYFRRVIMRCLERDPESRYQSAHDVLADLEAEQAAKVSSGRRTISLTMPLPTTGRSKAIVALALVAGLVAAVPIARRYVPAFGANREAAPAPVVVKKRIAVLPFKVIGDQAALAPFAAGIEEALSTKLFQLPALTVASAAAVERAAGKDSLAAISRDLGTPLLISGTLQSEGNGLRVTVALEDTEAGQRVFAQDFSGLAADLLTLEDQIYGRLITALELAPTSEELARALSHPTENIEAYQLYLRGRNAMRGQQDVKNVQAAIGFYEEALKQDARFARAYAGISDSALRMYRTTKEPSWAERALSAAQQAQRLDERLLEVHLALGSVYQATGKTTEAIAELTVASELAPGSDDVLRRLGRAYLSTGRGPEAIQAYEKAIAVNPYYWVSYGALGNTQLQLGAYDKAAEALKKVIELEPENVSGYNDLGAAYLQMGRYDESATAFKRALELQPIPQTYTNLGITYAYAGKHADAIPMFEKAVELAPNTEMFIGNLGDGYRWGGRAAQAAAAYDKAISLALKDLQVNPRNAIARGNAAMYYAKKGDGARARQMVNAARGIDRVNVNLVYFEAVIAVLGGRNSEALVAIEEALKAGYPLAAVTSDPDLRPLLDDPAFKQLAEKVQRSG